MLTAARTAPTRKKTFQRCIMMASACLLLVDGLDLGGQGALGQPRADGVAGLDVHCVTQELAVGGVDERVAAVEDGQRRERVEARGGMVEPRGPGSDGGRHKAA